MLYTTKLNCTPSKLLHTFGVLGIGTGRCLGTSKCSVWEKLYMCQVKKMNQLTVHKKEQCLTNHTYSQ